jgi:hypothetical protein
MVAIIAISNNNNSITSDHSADGGTSSHITQFDFP